MNKIRPFLRGPVCCEISIFFTSVGPSVRGGRGAREKHSLRAGLDDCGGSRAIARWKDSFNKLIYEYEKD